LRLFLLGLFLGLGSLLFLLGIGGDLGHVDLLIGGLVS